MVLKYDSLEKVKEHVQYNNSPVVNLWSRNDRTDYYAIYDNKFRYARQSVVLCGWR